MNYEIETCFVNIWSVFLSELKLPVHEKKTLFIFAFVKMRILMEFSYYETKANSSMALILNFTRGISLNLQKMRKTNEICEKGSFEIELKFGRTQLTLKLQLIPR